MKVSREKAEEVPGMMIRWTLEMWLPNVLCLNEGNHNIINEICTKHTCWYIAYSLFCVHFFVCVYSTNASNVCWFNYYRVQTYICLSCRMVHPIDIFAVVPFSRAKSLIRFGRAYFYITETSTGEVLLFFFIYWRI